MAGKVVNPHRASLTNPGDFFSLQRSKVDLSPPGKGTVSWELGFNALAEIFPKIPQKIIQTLFNCPRPILLPFIPWVQKFLPVAC